MCEKKCSGECKDDCPCEKPAVKRALVKFVVENDRPMTLKEAHEAMQGTVCPDCHMHMPRLLAARHTCG
jgi:hypothetical protein